MSLVDDSLADWRVPEWRERDLKGLAEFYPDDYKDRLQNLYPVYSWTFDDYQEKFEKLKDNFDIVFIDFAGRLQKEQLPVLETIDKVIVPILADEKDIESGTSFMNACHKLNIPTAWFLNRYSKTKFNDYIYDKGQSKFVTVNPNLTQLKWTASKNELLQNTHIKVQQAPEMFRSSSSTILPFDDPNKTIKSMLEFFLK